MRWQKRTRTGLECKLLVAYLVENKRVNGKPQQKTVCYLGSFKETGLRYPVQRHLFWKKMGKRILALNLEPAEAHKVYQALNKMVPQRTQEERTRALDEEAALLSGFRGREQAHKIAEEEYPEWAVVGM